MSNGFDKIMQMLCYYNSAQIKHMTETGCIHHFSTKIHLFLRLAKGRGEYMTQTPLM
jgi:hypothetical protein